MTCISYFLRKSAGKLSSLIGVIQILKTRADGTGFKTSSIVQLLFPLGVPCKCAVVSFKMHRQGSKLFHEQMWLQQTILGVHGGISLLPKPHQISTANDNQLSAQSHYSGMKTKQYALGPQAHFNHTSLILNTINQTAHLLPAKINTSLCMNHLLLQPMLTNSYCFFSFSAQKVIRPGCVLCLLGIFKTKQLGTCK